MARLKKGIVKLLDFFHFAILLPATLLVFAWFTIGGFRKVDGYSMYPYFHDKDIVVLYKLAYLADTPHRGDVVVFQYSEDNYYVKRVIALPGEDIMVLDGDVYINGQKLDESAYLDDSVYTSGGSFLLEGVEYTIPEGAYFLMGDNRPHSIDSRYFGPVTLDRIEGRIVMQILPLSRLKLVKRVSYNID